MTDDLYYRKLESISTTDLVDMIREKDERIEETEKENAELKEHIENIYANHCGNCNRNILNTNLKKENTELKEAIKHFNPCSEWNDNVHDCEFRHYAIEYGNKLTKAKKIIKTLLRLWNDVMTEYTVKSMIKEAEQFVKEIDK